MKFLGNMMKTMHPPPERCTHAHTYMFFAYNVRLGDYGPLRGPRTPMSGAATLNTQLLWDGVSGAPPLHRGPSLSGVVTSLCSWVLCDCQC